MAKQRPKQFEPSGEEDGWVFVKKQRVIIVLPSLPLPEHFTLEKPETFQSKAELKDGIADMQEIQVVVPSLPLPEHFTFQKAATSQSLAELRDGIADTQKATLEHSTLQKPPTLQSQADTQKASPVNTMVSSLSLREHLTLHKPATSQSQAELSADNLVTTHVHTRVPSLPVHEICTLQKPATSQLQAELRADKPESTLVHPVVPSLPLTEHSTLQKSTTSQSQAELRDFVADSYETTHCHSIEPETCPDFTAVDKPEIVMGHNLTTRKAPARKRSLHNRRLDPERGMESQRSRSKPIRFPRVMCSSVVMDNEKLRVLNLEKKVEKAGGLNEWVCSIGLGREFERMLKGQRMNKFQVANLTMEKLKHMGALAVGPRRKLIHAIRCVYHPHCLRAPFN